MENLLFSTNRHFLFYSRKYIKKLIFKQISISLWLLQNTNEQINQIEKLSFFCTRDTNVFINYTKYCTLNAKCTGKNKLNQKKNSITKGIELSILNTKNSSKLIIKQYLHR